jgi:hypothetical protein
LTYSLSAFAGVPSTSRQGSGEMNTVLVTGGRDYNHVTDVFRRLDALHRSDSIDFIVHGACCDKKTKHLTGADRIAEIWSIINEIPYLGVPARWSWYGDRAGPIRNGHMPKLCEELGRPVRRVVAFPGGGGTYGMVTIAQSLGLPIEDYR